MSLGLLSILALLPIVSVFVLIVLFRWPATRAMPVAFFITCVLAFFFWKTPPLQMAAATVDGLVTAVSILYIIFGAIFLLNLMQESGAIATIRQSMGHISDDRRVQAIIIAFFSAHSLKLLPASGPPLLWQPHCWSQLVFPPWEQSWWP